MRPSAKRVTDAPSPGGKDVGTCLAVCTHDKAGGGEASIRAVGDSTAGIEFDAEHPAILLPIVADLATREKHWGIDDIAID